MHGSLEIDTIVMIQRKIKKEQRWVYASYVQHFIDIIRTFRIWAVNSRSVYRLYGLKSLWTKGGKKQELKECRTSNDKI